MPILTSAIPVTVAGLRAAERDVCYEASVKRRAAALLALMASAAHCQRTGPPPAPALEVRATSSSPASPDAPRAAEPAASFQPDAEQDAGWSLGRVSRARAVAVRAARYDRDAGVSRIELEPLAGSGLAPLSREEDGVWVPLGYVEAAGAHVFGGAFQRGAWLPLVALAFLDERTGAWRPSRASGTDFIAMAAVAGPRGRFFAFVASPAGQSFEVAVFDPLADAFARAGEAPAPPPLGPHGDCPSDGRYTWGEGVDGFVRLDAGVIDFADERTLVLRYGDDSCLRRASTRRERRVDVLELFARRARPAPYE
jgi:hypothetical protein